MSKPQGLLLRGSTYYYRRRIPLDLVAAFDSKREPKESLETGDLRLAKQLRNAVEANLGAKKRRRSRTRYQSQNDNARHSLKLAHRLHLPAELKSIRSPQQYCAYRRSRAFPAFL
jgi:hypothetical protein